jgi:hypothetical protein
MMIRRVIVTGFVSLLLVSCFAGRSDAVDWIGSSSCGSSTCHGGTVDRGPAWNHSYSLSRNSDPHATAGTLLYDIDSQRIVTTLDPTLKTMAAYDVVLRKRCISCHLTATPADIASNSPLDQRLVGEGVSCESCHGPAGAWGDAHVLKTWEGPSRFEAATGMLDTESMLGRAEGCVRCHVGSRTADGIVRDMNHDLIAAGHPALRFDLETYNENMPHHWDESSEVEKLFNASSIKLRSVGRSVALAAAAKLSSERAAASKSTRVSELTAPWPELGEFDCFACHQTLRALHYRDPMKSDGKAKLSLSNGLPLWNSWFTALATASGDNQFRTFPAKPGGQDEWIKAANAVAELYRGKAIADAAAAPVDPQVKLDAIKASLDKAPGDWHTAAAMYLEMEAAAKDLAAEGKTCEKGLSISKALIEKVAPVLLFDSAATATSPRLRSPKNFDPRVFHKQAVAALPTSDQEKP